MGEVGTAYLTVEPKLSSDFGSKTAQGGLKDGESYGGKFSSAAKMAIGAGAVAIGNILAGAVQSVAANLGQVFQEMFQSAMDYEQLAGGVEKIFDQANISQIMADANAAYKDLNMSANEYLAAINQTGAAFAQTMGDQKGYDVARTGMLAIADYASGTGRNIDELNEKFALITRSTSSYQSIADQFSGILPATSKDFLEQAQAAGYLSDSYKSLTDVPIAEYQEAVSMMLEKGVADMGLAGNTALESAETMSGSLAMLKSSWQNLLAGILDENADLSALFGNLLESIGAVVSNFAPRIGLLFVRMFQQLPQVIYDTIMALPDTMLPALQAVFGEQMGQAISDNMRNITTLFETAWQVVSQVISNAMTIISGIVETVWPTISGVITGALTTISGIFQTVWPQIQSLVTTVMATVQNVIDTAWPSIQELITTVMAAIDSIMQTAWPIVEETVSTTMSAVLAFIEMVWPQIESTISGAVMVITTVINSMSSIVGTVTSVFNAAKTAIVQPIETARDTVKGIIDKIKGFFNFTVPTPHIPLPHFSISPSGWSVGDLLKGSIPSLGISWYAKGGIVDGATLIGAGEAGPEMILPKSGGLMDDFAEAVMRKENDDEVIRWLNNNLGPIIAHYTPTLSRRDFDRMARSAVV